MAMGLSMGTSANELIGRCSCCHSLLTNPKLTKTLRSPHQSQNFSTFRVPSLHLSRSEFSRKPSKCPMNALGSSSSIDSNSNDESPSSSQRSEDGSSTWPLPSRRRLSSSSPGYEKPKPAQSALARALAYKNAKETPGSSLKSQQVEKSSVPERPKNAPEVEIIRGQSFQSRLQSADASSAPESSSLPSFESSSSLTSPAGGDTPSNSGEFRVTPSGAESELQGTSQGPKTPTSEVAKYIEDKLEAVSKTESDPVQGKRVGETPPEAKKKESTISLDSFKKAQAYNQQQAEMIAALKGKPDQPPASSNSSSRTTDSKSSVAGENLVEVENEIVTRGGVMKKKVVNPEKAFSNVKELRRTGVTSIDFAGLRFADKKQGGRTVVREDYQTPPPGTLPEVEIITKEAGTGTAGDSEDSDLYKPKVSTWGLFPRPADISKAYGGGRTIRPGEPLETEEVRISREATQKLLADYKMGLDVDPRVKAECEKLFNQGNSLMESGDLRAAHVLFENVMEKMIFQSELHGSAALQGAICLHSLARFSEAKEVYEKLLSHPSRKIRKQAKQLYGFRAMENLKMWTGNKWDTSVYAKYFEAFADGYSNIYNATEDETSENLMEQTIGYSLLLFVPILLVVVLVLSRNSAT